MAADHTLAWAYVEDAFAEEDDVIAQARYEAGEYGIASLSAATCAFLRQLARIAGAKSAVEVGTGTGVSGMYLLSVPGLSLTSIDVESEAQHCAREFFAAAGVRSGRIRLINGRSVDLLPRLAANSYDFVLLDGDPLETPGDAQEALRILRPGGLLVLARALIAGRVAGPAPRTADVQAIRALAHGPLAPPDADAPMLPPAAGPVGATVLCPGPPAPHPRPPVHPHPATDPRHTRPPAGIASAFDRSQSLLEACQFGIVELENEPTAALHGYADDDPASLPLDFERTIAGAGFHGRHGALLPPEA